jgi:hypothetical protein
VTEDRFRHPYPAGLRVRNYGEQYDEAIHKGTAVIVEAKPQRDGTYEYRVRRDKPLVPGGDLETWWASYSTFVAINEHFGPDGEPARTAYRRLRERVREAHPEWFS